jgi:Arc/MetJ-type ribon-helix-helix transcriptional regulator
MSIELSPQIEQYLASVVAGGMFPSQEAALEAAITALREKTGQPPFVPAEHLELVEQGMASVRAGRTRELSDADWEQLAQHARDVASGNSSENA